MVEQKKSIHELRSIAQSKGIKFAFSDDVLALSQKINTVNDALTPKALEPIPRPEYDSRLRTKPPGKICTEQDMLKRLEGHIRRGLIVSFPAPETWRMQCGIKVDTGNMRMPPKVMLDAADRLMR